MDKDQEIAPGNDDTGNTPAPEATQVPGLPSAAPVTDLGDLFAGHQGMIDTPAFTPGEEQVIPPAAPRLNKDGSTPKKRGRKPGGYTQPEVAPAVAQEPPPVERPRLSATQAAKQTANLTVVAAVAICGEEVGVPRSEEEGKQLIETYRDYFNARGVPNLPPEVGLLVGVWAYMAPRMRDPRAKSYVEKVKEKVAALVAKIRGK